MSMLISQKKETGDESSSRYKIGLWFYKLLHNPWRIAVLVLSFAGVTSILVFFAGLGVKKAYNPKIEIGGTPASAQLATSAVPELEKHAKKMRAAWQAAKANGKSVKFASELVPEYLPAVQDLPGMPAGAQSWQFTENGDLEVTGLAKDGCAKLNQGTVFETMQGKKGLHCYSLADKHTLVYRQEKQDPAGFWNMRLIVRGSGSYLTAKLESDGELVENCDPESLNFNDKPKVVQKMADTPWQEEVPLCVPAYKGETHKVLLADTWDNGSGHLALKVRAGGEYKVLAFLSNVSPNCASRSGLTSTWTVGWHPPTTSKLMAPSACFPGELQTLEIKDILDNSKSAKKK